LSWQAELAIKLRTQLTALIASTSVHLEIAGACDTMHAFAAACQFVNQFSQMQAL